MQVVEIISIDPRDNSEECVGVSFAKEADGEVVDRLIQLGYVVWYKFAEVL